MIKIALFASGTGSNVLNILNYFSKRDDVEIVAVLSNKKDAGALNHAINFGVETLIFDREGFYNQGIVLEKLLKMETDLVVLAGFLWQMPQSIVTAYDGRMLNVHPALLPAYGGKGMYGMNVHRAVVQNKEPKSGITIHLVSENYDEGASIAQFECEILPADTPEDLAAKIHELEKKYFPAAIDNYILALRAGALAYNE